ncbi:phospho-sugar mutase [Corynebacterium silvaticum]|uniref:Phospho-sugar mutase n=1 Tax=Corynebacterium silvaticum TaxID=2320431 RepID=A0A7Y4LI18_9CORY|nr:phospho-sugar mutase [Corynebacterium silvaticum]ARU45614.1 phospho-sugar mutase [Corynebacterium silvaticum]MBH5300203.1 phospho-sugar mutase [Corynebacterium silvaticum]NOM65619.1 phospho-sugar mutase [Corynebacterium silvaticum]NON70431.1 phospho-sugar mutase [Corynebacterium silvaticum]TFA92048.1 phospho-sugar mutase [Corynebacterium silvaticum]
MSLRFGTAGVRAPVGPASNQMNVGNVTKFTSAVAMWLAEQAAASPTHHARTYPQDLVKGIGDVFHDDAAPLRVAVGYDARYGSHAFATATAEVFAGAGFEVFLMPMPAPTQLIPWLIRTWDLDGGVQITASHNPAADNGYKVYCHSGRQLIDASARRIEAIYDGIDDSFQIPRVSVRPSSDLLRHYIDDAVSTIIPAQADLLRVNSDRANLRVAFTAMHGVGGRTLQVCLQAAGFAHVFPVYSQLYPDPTFPTVDFPNPEEPAAVAALLEHGEAVDADVLIALDPDADRCAVGIRTEDGTLRMLRGDELGPLLAARLVPNWTDKTDKEAKPQPVVATTIVSSQLLSVMAKDRGWLYRETPTGFKNLAAAAASVAHDGGVAYACEEANGVAPDLHRVGDKDGVVTALVACAWAAELKGLGLGLHSALHDLYRQYGYFTGTQIAVRTIDPAELVSDWIANPPKHLAGITVTATQLPELRGLKLSGSNEDASIRAIVRASGTESKVKMYLEVSQATSVEQAEELLAQLCNEVRNRALRF